MPALSSRAGPQTCPQHPATHIAPCRPRPCAPHTGNCEYPDGSWELKYCLQSPPAGSPAFSPDAYFSSVLGASRPADTVRNSGVLLAPFEFKPGTGHHYRLVGRLRARSSKGPLCLGCATLLPTVPIAGPILSRLPTPADACGVVASSLPTGSICNYTILLMTCHPPHLAPTSPPLPLLQRIAPSNEAYQLASHIVEHVSGVPIAQYFRDHIFGPLNMTSTFLDVSGGVDGVYKNAVPYPSYMAYLNPVEIGQFAFDKGYIGNATYKAGTLKAAPPPPGQRPAAAGTAAAGAPGRWAKTGRAPAPSVPGSDFGYASGSGAIQSSAADVTTWLRALTAEPKRLGLRPETVRRMLNTSTRVPIPQGASPFGSLGGAVKALGGRLRYAQGVVVVQDPPGAPPSRLGVSGLYYKGSLGGFDSTYYLVPDKSDASKDVLAYVMTTTDTAFAPYAPFITRAGGAAGAAANKSCVFTPPAARGGDGAAHPVPAYMCDAKETLMGQGPAALLIDTYLRAFTGKGTLGIR